MTMLTSIFEKLRRKKQAAATPAPVTVAIAAPVPKPQLDPAQATSALLALGDQFRLGNIDTAEAGAKVQELLDAGADAKAQAGNNETTLFRVCCRDGSEKMALMLIAAGADVNHKLGNGDAPILRAAEAAAPETMRVLLDAGADAKAIKTEPPRIDLGDFQIGGGERDVFHYIVVNPLDEKPEKLAARTACLKLMLERGYDPGREISYIYASKPHLRVLYPAMTPSKKLDDAVEMNDTERVKDLLAGGLHPDCAAAFGKDTALFNATTKGNVNIMKALIDAGADANMIGKNSNLTPLQRAIWADQPKAFDYLLSRRASPEILGNGTGKDLLAMAESNPTLAAHVRDALARDALTLHEPMKVAKPIRLKMGSQTPS